MFKWFGNLLDSNEKELKRLAKTVSLIDQLEPAFQALTPEELRAKTAGFKNTLSQNTASLKKNLAEKRQELDADKKQTSENGGILRNTPPDKYVRGLEEEVNSLENAFIKSENVALDALLPEAFAAVREAARRTIGQRHYDVQLIGGMVLHQGRIAEMKTGEGKTLVATLPLYLNALTGRGVHLVTVNDYLARRDPYWMGPVFEALGVTVASIYPMQTPDEMQPARLYDGRFDSGEKNWPHFRKITRNEAYLADITYGQSSEFGFDYLRDNMVMDLKQCVQRPLNYAIVDEVDNLLIDEARTPLIISGQREEQPREYEVLARVAGQLKNGLDYKMSEKGRGVDEITEDGFENAERLLRREAVLSAGAIYDEQNSGLLHHLRNAITAKEAYHRDKEYVVKDGEIIIVDEFTGRLMLGRRYEAGLHQAIEAKEHVRIQKETMTYATITIQNYFRMYHKLAGMTGTAVTEAEEFSKIYSLEVVQIPPHRPMIREDAPDRVYKTESGKFKAVTAEVIERHQKGQPVLLGTASIDKSEILSNMLKLQGIPHEVLNAKQHEREANIIAQAGRTGAVTVATNMAGRGVDIILGGRPENMMPDEWRVRHEEVVKLGGLHVIGTERHDARRIDNQLRGRAGRQGDPGSSRFYISLEDDLMKRFGGDRIRSVMEWAGMDEDTAIENAMVSKSIQNAQVKVEGYHFDLRKHLVDYDDVINTQRRVIYEERRKILSGTDLKQNIMNMVTAELKNMVERRTGGAGAAEPDYRGLADDIKTIIPLPGDFTPENLTGEKGAEICSILDRHVTEIYEKRERDFTPEVMRELEKIIMLRTLDSLWIEHLTAMEGMREGVGLEAVAQHDPLVAYKTRGHEMFQELLAGIQGELVHTIFHLSLKKAPATVTAGSPPAKQAILTGGTTTSNQKAGGLTTTATTGQFTGVKPSPMTRMTATNAGGVGKPAVKVAGKKVGRNDPCPCGSGKKYKHCCGQ